MLFDRVMRKLLACDKQNGVICACELRVLVIPTVYLPDCCGKDTSSALAAALSTY